MAKTITQIHFETGGGGASQPHRASAMKPVQRAAGLWVSETAVDARLYKERTGGSAQVCLIRAQQASKFFFTAPLWALASSAG
jgi:hypothetical protein